jgi:rRNA-processing protein FCF1
MNFTKINISMPVEIEEKLSSWVQNGKKSAFITECVKMRLEALEREKLEKDLIEGYSLRRDEALEITKEFDIALLDGLEDEDY